MASQFDMNAPHVCGFCFEVHDVVKTPCSRDRLMMIVKLLRAERATMVETQKQLAAHAQYQRRAIEMCCAELDRLYKLVGEDINATEKLQAEVPPEQLELPNLQRAQEN